MNPVIDRLKLIFVGLFLVLNVVLAIWQFGWVVPRKNCEAARKWWDGSQRVCAQPILVSDITGRVIDNPKAHEEALRAIGRLPTPSMEADPKAKP
jgi:hypothetical protein